MDLVSVTDDGRRRQTRQIHADAHAGELWKLVHFRPPPAPTSASRSDPAVVLIHALRYFFVAAARANCQVACCRLLSGVRGAGFGARCDCALSQELDQ